MNLRSLHFSACACLLGFALSLAGCSTTTGGGGIFGSGLSAPLEQQRQYLADELRGTPVVVEATRDGRLHVAVPLKFCFDPGRSIVKKPLAAVLDRVATGVKRYGASPELSVAGPPDAGGKGSATLAQERAAATRDYLVARGIPTLRFTTAQASGEAAEVFVGERAAAH